MIESGEHAFSSHRQVFGFIVLDQIESKATKGGEVLRGVAAARAALVFAEGDIQGPVQGVFHAPVPPDGARKCLCAQREARQVIRRRVPGPQPFLWHVDLKNLIIVVQDYDDIITRGAEQPELEWEEKGWFPGKSVAPVKCRSVGEFLMPGTEYEKAGSLWICRIRLAHEGNNRIHCGPRLNGGSFSCEPVDSPCIESRPQGQQQDP